MAAVAAAAGAAASLMRRAMLGDGAGHRLFGLRSLWQVTGMPAAPWRLPRIVLDVRRGADPLRPAPRPVSLATARVHDGSVDAVRARRLVILTDAGARYVVQQSVVVGRDPVSPAGSGHALIAIPDLSRTIARTHLMVTADGDGVHVTDLGSEHGTRVHTPEGQEIALRPHQPHRIPRGSRLRLGAREVYLEGRPIPQATPPPQAQAPQAAPTSQEQR